MKHILDKTFNEPLDLNFCAYLCWFVLIFVRNNVRKHVMPSFILDKPQSAKDTFIFAFVSCSDGRLKYSLKEKVNPSCWDFDRQRPKVAKGDQKAKALLLNINRVYDAVETLKTNLSITGESLTKGKAAETISATLRHKKPVKKLTFEDAAHAIIQEMEDGTILTDRGKIYSEGTIKNYRQSLNALLGFASDKKISLEFTDVSMSTYNLFIAHCNSLDWSLNYTGQHLKNWKCLLKQGFRKGWHTNRIHEFDDFKTLQEETYDIYLNEDELDRLVRHNLTFNREYDLARDWFIIGCYTALRVSDLKGLTTDKITGNLILLANEKTDERVVIPIHPIITDILKKWGGFPPPIADQTINEKIKQVAALCKIDGKVLYSLTKGGVRQDFYLDKSEMVSLHTARRSFITNARKMGMPDAIVMKLAGIRKPQTLYRYDKLSQDEAAHIAADHAFFKKK